MDTLGVVESQSIAAGVEIADGMLKAAQVELVRAAPICSGRYLIYISGDRQAVQTSVDFAWQSGRKLAGGFVIANVSPRLIFALKKTTNAEEGDALGIVESRTVSAALVAADCALKRSSVRLLRLVAGQGINGKAYFAFGGDVASVQEAVGASKISLGQHLIEAALLPGPEDAVIRAITGDRS